METRYTGLDVTLIRCIYSTNGRLEDGSEDCPERVKLHNARVCSST